MNFNFLRKEAPPGLCCIYLLPDKIMVSHALSDNQKPSITFFETHDYKPETLRHTLDKIIKKHSLDGMSCTWVLHSSDYQLFLLDPPSVPEAEMSLALRWQVKELIHFPAEEAAIEYFPVPSLLDIKKKIYVSVARKTRLQEMANMIRDAGLNLKYIDISELALRNINALYDDDQCYLGLLAFNQNNVEFIISHEKNLLLARRLPIPHIADVAALLAQWLDTLVPEIRNSFTYCKSQQQQENVPAKLLLSGNIPDLSEQLGKLLSISVEKLQIRKKMDFEFIIPSDNYLPIDNLITLGGALREEQTNAKY